MGTVPGKETSTGYASRAYAESLSEFGELLHLPRCGGFLLKRKIPGTKHYDALGCYPLFCCGDWSQLSADLADLPKDLVSVSIVADTFGAHSSEGLTGAFDVVNPYKMHYVVDLEQEPNNIGTRHHRRQARRALRDIQVEECKDPGGFTDYWIELYRNLQKRHKIQGIRAFSKHAFHEQLQMPEITVHQAFFKGELVGAQLYYVLGDMAYCHLGAVNDKGYEMGAFYAMDYYSFDYFSGVARKLDLGGGAGINVATNDGLCRYKEGWSTETRPVYFCGRVVNVEHYTSLIHTEEQRETNYFPPYRLGEFS